jgi:hypothetical protein
MDKGAMVRAFNEWMDRYIHDPHAFEAEFQTVVRHLEELSEGEIPSYGESCAAYMFQLDTELK